MNVSPHSSAPLIDSSPSRGRWLVLYAALLWSSSGFFARAPLFAGWPGLALAFWRALFACAILLPMVRQPQWSWKLVPAVLTFVIMNYTYLTALVEGSPANAIWLQATSPIWVLLVGVLFLGEKADWRDWLVFGCCIAGIGLILFFEASAVVSQPNASHSGVRAVLYGIASGVFYAGVVLSLRQLRSFDSAWLVGLNHLITALVLGPFVWIDGHWPRDPIHWAILAAFGMFQMGLPYVLFARGLREIPGHEASGIGLLEPLLMPVWVFVAWGIRPAWWTMAGGALILFGLIVKYLGAVRRPPGTVGDRLN